MRSSQAVQEPKLEQHSDQARARGDEAGVRNAERGPEHAGGGVVVGDEDAVRGDADDLALCVVGNRRYDLPAAAAAAAACTQGFSAGSVWKRKEAAKGREQKRLRKEA